MTGLVLAPELFEIGGNFGRRQFERGLKRELG